MHRWYFKNFKYCFYTCADFERNSGLETDRELSSEWKLISRTHGTDGAVSCLFPQFSVRVHDNKPNTNQLKVSVSACDVVAVTQRSAQEVEASWSSGLGGKTRQLMAERVQRLQRQKDKKRYLIYGWEDYPVEEKIIQIHFDIWNVGDVWPPIWRRTSHPFAVTWRKCCFYLWGFFCQWGQWLSSLGNFGHLPAGPAQNNTARLGLVERATDESNPPGPLTETNQEETRP